MASPSKNARNLTELLRLVDTTLLTCLQLRVSVTDTDKTAKAHTMLLRPSAPFTAVAGLVAADSATIFGALNGVNALLLQTNTQLLNLDANNIAMAGPQLGMLGQTIEPSLVGFTQQVPSTTPLNAQKTENLNAARVVLGKLLSCYW